MLHDLRQAFRTLRKHPGFVALAALVLALGIGLNTAIFSIVYAMLFKPLPVHEPDRLVSMYVTTARQPQPMIMHGRAAAFLKEHSGVLDDVAMRWSATYPLRADDETQPVNLELVTSNYFDVLGVKPALGRTLRPEEDRLSSTERALVISHALWERRFGGDPHILGRQVQLTPSNSADLTFTIVGVMARGFSGLSEPWKPAQAWATPVQAQPTNRRPSDVAFGAGIARLASGVSLDQARAAVAAHSEAASGQSYFPGAHPRHVLLKTGDVHVHNNPSDAVIPVRLAGALTFVVAMVLLVAATNIAGILTARGVGRSGEIAVRRVLGAAPLRIVRQLLAESLMLSALGGAVGFLLAAWLLDLFRAFTPIQYAFDVSMESGVVLFTVAVCAVAGVAVGVVPALQATRLDILPWLAGSGQMQTRQTRRRLRYTITLPQVAVSLVLLLVAGVYVRALLKTELADLGYAPANLVVVNPMLRLQPGERTNLPNSNTDEQYAERSRRFYQQLMQRLETIPGAPAVAVADRLPLHDPAEQPQWTVLAQERYYAGDREGPPVEASRVSPGYFGTMGMHVIAGRDFDERDTRSMPGVAVVSASAARRLWPEGTALGRSVAILPTWNPKAPTTWYEVVGIVSDVRPVLQDHEARPFVYLSLGQDWRPAAANVLVRGAADSRALIPEITKAITGADSFADVRQTQTMAQMMAQILYPRRVAAAVLAASGAVALFLATLGIYGVVSYSVAQRTGEIGVRMALGAARSDIIRLVLREGAWIAGIGAAAGLALGYGAVSITSSRYLALPALDPATLVVTPLVLAAIVLLACYVPARRAGRVDPMDVLRQI